MAGSQVSVHSPGRWVSIRRAAEILGVNRATLRQWGDAGKVRTFTTPGGHRRFSEDELVSLTDVRPATTRTGLAEVLLATHERYEAVARRCLAEKSWFRSFDEAACRRFRILGSSMLNLVGAYLIGGRRERDRSLAEGREVAVEYGAEAARVGLSLPDATEAFLLFRTPVLESLNRWLRDADPARREASELSRRANYFMDQVLVSMAASHDASRAALGKTS